MSKVNDAKVWIALSLREFGPTDAPSIVEHVQQDHAVGEEDLGEALWQMIDDHELVVLDDLTIGVAGT